MAFDPHALPTAAVSFLTDRHLATLTTLRADGSPHVVPVGFSWDDDHRLARVITDGGSVKAHNAGRAGPIGRAVLCQVSGREWLSLEGPVRVSTEPAEVAEAVRRYTERYRRPRHNPHRVVLVIDVDRILGYLA